MFWKLKSKNKNKYKFDKLEYLIIVNEEDFKDKSLLCKCSFIDKLKQCEKKLKGTINIITIHDAYDYSFKSIVKLYTMYVKLPKEKLYIETSKFEYEYMKSKILELIYIFRLIGAKKLDMSYQKNDYTKTEFKTGAFIDINSLQTDVSTEINEKNQSNYNLNTKLEFSSNDFVQIDSIETLLNDPLIYYLNSNNEWKNFIWQRLTGQASKIHFKFVHESVIQSSISLVTKLYKLGIDFKSSSDNSTNIVVEFNAYY
jgi:hypothetical protein